MRRTIMHAQNNRRAARKNFLSYKLCNAPPKILRLVLGGAIAMSLSGVFRWIAMVGFLATLLAPRENVSGSTKLMVAAVGLVLTVYLVWKGFRRWLKQDGRLPPWDEIKPRAPIVPEPPLKEPGRMASALGYLLARWMLNWAKDDPKTMGELYDIGNKCTPHNPKEALRFYFEACGGDPTQPGGPLWPKLRIAEMYEDGEGIDRDAAFAARIYKTIPAAPSAMLHFAIAHVEGRGVTQNYVEAYKLLLVADRLRGLHPLSKAELRHNAQSRRENRRHIRIRELMAMLEAHLRPEQCFEGREAARAYWEVHR